MRRKSESTLFVGLDMADLATVCTFPLRSLLLLSWDDSRARGRPRGASASSIGGRCCGDAFGFFAGEASFTVSFKAGKLRSKSEKKID